MIKDYYRVLGVVSTVSQSTIKKAFRRLAKKYHPDLNPGSLFSEEKFKGIAEAYDILGDSRKREEYDKEYRKRTQRSQSTSGRAFARSGRTAPGQAARGSALQRERKERRQRAQAWGVPQRGEDVIQKIETTFELAVKGGKMRVWTSQDSLCPRCCGSGARKDSLIRICHTCKGEGMLGVPQEAAPSTRLCPKCQGRGTLIKEICSGCEGRGFVLRRRLLSVDIPPGVNTGSRVVLAGQGRAGRNLGPRGDLILIVRVKPHRLFRRLGFHLETTVWIDMVTAALGGKILVPTLNGNTRITVPPGTRSGARICLKGKGVQNSDGQVGDLSVVLGIQTPKKLSEKQKELLEQLRKSLARVRPKT